MPGLFPPRYVQDGKELLFAARKLFRHKRDLLSPADAAACQSQMDALDAALRQKPREPGPGQLFQEPLKEPRKNTRRSASGSSSTTSSTPQNLTPEAHQATVEQLGKNLEAFFTERFPESASSSAMAMLRENCEVFLVAILIAFAIRTYFLQPFTIPTGSMWPTLNGVMITTTAPAALTGPADSDEREPGWLGRLLDTVRYGRSWFRIVSDGEDTIRSVRDVRQYWFINYTLVECDRQSFKIPAPVSTVLWRLNLRAVQSERSSRSYADVLPVQIHKGQLLAEGYADTGDHVFVNKMAYHFRTPRRGEVFVFGTGGVPVNGPGTAGPNTPSEYYIKRLAGLPGDLLRIEPPRFFVNGEVAREPGFRRVMEGRVHEPSAAGYHGYGPGPGEGYLSTSASTFQLPERRYFALGDNSYHSSDSRFWGTVPEENLVGCGLMVYWPFNKHWGRIR